MSVAILGATGSVGRNACAVATDLGLPIVGLAAKQDVTGMAQLCQTYTPATAVLANEAAAQELASQHSEVAVAGGDDAITALASGAAEIVVAAIAGVAGLPSTRTAIAHGKKVLLANKESLIVAGKQLLADCQATQAQLIPVDSEHSALFELFALLGNRKQEIAQVWLTASGGPFREQTNLDEVTPAQACTHPVWQMGAKICVDSATLMNKGLEVIEACYLFDLAPEQVAVVIHPQAVVHAIVEFKDGTSIAQCGPADMRVALGRAFTWPQPLQQNYGRIDWPNLGQLEFSRPDTEKFPCLQLAREALVAGGDAPAVLNAANEIAVQAFIADKIKFTQIPAIVATTVTKIAGQFTHPTIEELLTADNSAREFATQLITTN